MVDLSLDTVAFILDMILFPLVMSGTFSHAVLGFVMFTTSMQGYKNILWMHISAHVGTLADSVNESPAYLGNQRLVY